MQPHEERVIQEDGELQIKAVKLIEFTSSDAFKKLPVMDQQLLEIQLGAMIAYSNVLKLRISLFKTT